ncbi:MAG: hypothetical protein IT289_00230 [Oligoflexia bacterium]|nr:hypothetical protein [Oligoflexia bacterium]
MIHLRHPHWLFLDITKRPRSVSESDLLNRLTDIDRHLCLGISFGLHNSTAQAQITAQAQVPDSQLLQLPLEFLIYCEGLKPFEPEEKSKIRALIETLETLGLKTLKDFVDIPATSISQRWGALGSLLRRRLLGQDYEPIDIFEPAPVLQETYAFDFSCVNLNNLTEALHEVLKRLEWRLIGSGRWAQSMSLEVRHQYSNKNEVITIQPGIPTSEAQQWIKLLTRKLEGWSFENPVAEISVLAFASDRQSLQLHLWNDFENDFERVTPVINSLSTELGLNSVGFAVLENSHVPENGWTLSQIKIKPQAKNAFLPHGPRPTKLLTIPQLLSKKEVDELQYIFRGSERIEAEWWSDSPIDRNYFIARQGSQLVWVFKEVKTQKYFLHGYFD